MNWKEEMELKTSSSYVLHSFSKQRANYICAIITIVIVLVLIAQGEKERED